jgi:hypothetical protein
MIAFAKCYETVSKRCPEIDLFDQHVSDNQFRFLTNPVPKCFIRYTVGSL